MFELSKWFAFLNIFEGVEICIRIKRLSSISTRFLELYRWFSIVGDSLSDLFKLVGFIGSSFLVEFLL